MPSNRYDVPQGTQSPYISQYVPLPLQDIAGLAKQHQDAYQKNLDDTYHLQDLMASVNAIDPHQKYKKQLDSKYSSRISDLTDKITSGKASYEVANEINKLKREFVNDPTRVELESSWTNYNAYQKDKIAKGDKYGEWYDNYVPFKGSNPDGSMAGYRYTGMKEVQNHAEEARKQMAGVNEDGYDLGNAVLGEDGIIRDSKSGAEHITSKKIANLAKGKVGSFLATKEGQDFVAMAKYYNPEADAQQLAYQYLYNAGANQIFSKSKSDNNVQVTSMWDNLHKDKKEREALEAQYRLGSTEGNIDMTPSTARDALAMFGMNVQNVDDKGNISYNNMSLTREDVKKQFDRLQQDYKDGKIELSQYVTQLENLNRYVVPKMNSNQKIANEYYAGLVRGVVNSGADLSQFKSRAKDSSGKSYDYDAMKNYLVELGKNINTQAPTIQNFQAKLGDDLTSHYFGEHKGEEGNFVKSPLFQKMKIYEHNNPESAMNIESEEKASKLAENGRFIGLDFNDKNLGAMVFTATEGKGDAAPKLYTGVVPDKTVKALMQPVHAFTQQMNNLVVKAPSKDELFHNKTVATKAIDNLKNRILYTGNLDKVGQLDKVLEMVNGADRLAVGGTSDQDKILIGRPDNSTGVPTMETIVVDLRTGEVKPMDLGAIQNEESTKIQMKIAPGFNSKAQGYVNKDVEYR
jgi:hypothetical protein